MSDAFLDQIYRLNHSGESFAVATVVRVEKPISAQPDDKAIIKTDGTLQGWIARYMSEYAGVKYYFAPPRARACLIANRRNTS
ncbi:MAG: XdhC family protein [Chloroflexi bacterium]|nr:XdhC family protein [Chloroflexota bacterium]